MWLQNLTLEDWAHISDITLIPTLIISAVTLFIAIRQQNTVLRDQGLDQWRKVMVYSLLDTPKSEKEIAEQLRRNANNLGYGKIKPENVTDREVKQSILALLSSNLIYRIPDLSSIDVSSEDKFQVSRLVLSDGASPIEMMRQYQELMRQNTMETMEHQNSLMRKQHIEIMEKQAAFAKEMQAANSESQAILQRKRDLWTIEENERRRRIFRRRIDLVLSAVEANNNRFSLPELKFYIEKLPGVDIDMVSDIEGIVNEQERIGQLGITADGKLSRIHRRLPRPTTVSSN